MDYLDNDIKFVGGVGEARARLLDKELGIRTLGDIFVPIIPAIVASGFLMGIMEALNFMVNNGFLNIDTTGSV